MSELVQYPESTPLWIECDLCEDFWCTFHDCHVADCPCPGVEQFITFGVDPYKTPKSDPKVLVAIASQRGAR
jgi:hypothetical protein